MFIGDTETGRRIVHHEPNLASGGRATETDLQEFLNRTGSIREPSTACCASLIGRDHMPTTVYFATNRVVTNATDPINGYKAVMVPPLQPQDVTYGTAIVNGVDDTSGAEGVVSQISDVEQGGFRKRR